MRITIEQDDFTVSFGNKESNKQTDSETLFHALRLLDKDPTNNFYDLQTEYAVLDYMGRGSCSDLFKDLGIKLDCFRRYLDLIDSSIWEEDVVDGFSDFLAEFFSDKNTRKNMLKFYDWVAKKEEHKEKEQDKFDSYIDEVDEDRK